MSNDQQRRYIRQTTLAGFGEAAQAKLATASVLMVGAGGLGAACLPYLAAAGIGRIGIIDHDHVELSNLHRQVIYEEADINRLKVQSAADRLSELRHDLDVDVYAQRLTPQNAAAIIARYDLVADGCDRFETRLAVNAACWQQQKTLVSASTIGWQGQLLSVQPAQNSPCYQCLVPEAPSDPDRCSETGVLGALCGITGAMQASEIIKQIAGITPNLTGQWLRYDARSAQSKTATISKNPQCPVCS